MITATLLSIKLLKQYGKKVYSNNIQEIIKNSHPETYLILNISQKYKRDSYNKLTHIYKILKKTLKDYEPNFKITANKNIVDKAENILKELNPTSNIHTQETDQNEIYVHWEWSYYKRSIEKDTRELLWIYN